MAHGNGEKETFGSWAMSDDLVKRLRKRKLRVLSDAYEAIYEACDRIEQLEEALREVRVCTTEHGGASRALKIINAALGGEER
jgi:hypothetical protein